MTVIKNVGLYRKVSIARPNARNPTIVDTDNSSNVSRCLSKKNAPRSFPSGVGGRSNKKNASPILNGILQSNTESSGGEDESQSSSIATMTKDRPKGTLISTLWSRQRCMKCEKGIMKKDCSDNACAKCCQDKDCLAHQVGRAQNDYCNTLLERKHEVN